MDSSVVGNRQVVKTGWLAVFFVLLILILSMFNSSSALAAQYQGIQQWGAPAGGTSLGDFLSSGGIAVNSALGVVYVSDFGGAPATGNDRIQIFDTSGTPIDEWGSFGTADTSFSDPYGVAVNQTTGYVYVADTGNDRIKVFDSSGTAVGAWGSSGSSDSSFTLPRGISVHPVNGNVYVADPLLSRVTIFDASGNYLDKFATIWPSAVAINPVSGNVYVAAELNDLIRVYNTTGTALLNSFGGTGSGDGQFNRPWDVNFDSSGNLFVVDLFNDRIQKFTAGGTHLESFGMPGFALGEFSDPRRVVIDSSGYVYVTDQGDNRVEKFELVASPVLPATGANTSVILVLAIFMVATGALFFRRGRSQIE